MKDLEVVRTYGLTLNIGNRAVSTPRYIAPDLVGVFLTVLCAWLYYAPPAGDQPVEASVGASYTAPAPPPLRIDKVSEVPVAPVKWHSGELEYVKRFQNTAIAEMDRYGIPASITMAQGILESGKGMGTLAMKANNHMGIKCSRKRCRKSGHCIPHADDTPNDRFLSYPTAWASYRDHSKFLASGERYADLFKLDERDYEGWAKGLSAATYATDPLYADKLIRLIERLRLYRLDEGMEIK